jgi:hypothetical protein
LATPSLLTLGVWNAAHFPPRKIAANRLAKEQTYTFVHYINRAADWEGEFSDSVGFSRPDFGFSGRPRITLEFLESVILSAAKTLRGAGEILRCAQNDKMGNYFWTAA